MLSIKELTKLEKKSFRDETGVFLIEGKKVFEEARKAKLVMDQVLVTEKFLFENRNFLYEHQLTFRDVISISQHNAERLAGTVTTTGLFAVVQKPKVTLAEVQKTSFVAVLEDIRDPGNLGTMIRTADWFGVNSIILSSSGVDLYNSKVIRATMGSLFHLTIYTSDDLVNDLKTLKQDGFRMVVTRPEGTTPLQSIKLDKSCIIFGNESLGTSAEVDELADDVFTIPKYGDAESLNVGVAFGITLNQLLQAKV